MAEEAPKKIEKEKIETVKLLLSSLFARKQKFLIVDGKNKNKFIYTNMPYERTIYYRTTPEDTLCGVSINNTVAPLLYEAFPKFGEIVGEINLQQFMSALNKCLAKDATKWPEIYVGKEPNRNGHEELLMDLPADEEGNIKSVCIGRLIPPDALDGYDEIMRKFCDFVKEPLTLDLSLPLEKLSDSVIMTDMELPGAIPARFKFPIRDGISMVSFKEYLKKRGLPMNYKALVQYKSNSNAARISLGYDDDWVSCISMMPGTIWFPFQVL